MELKKVNTSPRKKQIILSTIRQFSKEKVQMANKDTKTNQKPTNQKTPTGLTLLITKKMQTKSIPKFCLTPGRFGRHPGRNTTHVTVWGEWRNPDTLLVRRQISATTVGIGAEFLIAKPSKQNYQMVQLHHSRHV